MPSRHFSLWAVLLPAILVGVFEWYRHSILEPVLPPNMGNLAAAVIVGMAAAAYVRITSLMIRNQERRLAKSRQETVLLQERDRIAREMHDSIAQTLFYLGVRLGDLEEQVTQGQGAEARTTLSVVRQHLDNAHRQVRQGIADLRQKPAQRSAGVLMRDIAAEMEVEYDLVVGVTDRSGDAHLPEKVQEQVRGIVHEALMNSIKHGRVTTADVALARTAAGLTIDITDSGQGFDPTTTPQGFGLAMMQERADMVRGTVAITSAPGAGARVRLTLPLKEEAYDQAGAGPTGRR